MCLSSIKQTFPPNDNMMMCYKVFDSDEDNHRLDNDNKIFYGEFKHTTIPRKFGIHYKSNNTKIGLNRYESGFHCFTNLQSAKYWSYSYQVVCKVLVWDIRTIGEQDFDGNYKTVVVAKNMMIMEEVK